MKKKYSDMDPLEEIRAIREEISREFKTVSAYGEYLRKKYPGASVAKRAASRKSKPAKKVPARRRIDKQLVHV